MRGLVYFVLSTLFVILLRPELEAGVNKWSSSGPFGVSASDIFIDPQDPSLGFVVGDALYRTTNGGGAWTATEIGVQAVTAHSRTGELFAAGFSVFHSSNHGASWQLVSSDSFKGVYATDIEMDPANPQVLYVVTQIKGVFKSTNGGQTWIAKNSGLNLKPQSNCSGTEQIEVDPANGNNLYALLPCTVYKSTNGGGSWKASSNGLNFSGLATALDIDPANSQVIYAGGGTGIFKSTNGGGSWASTNCNCGVDDLAVDPRNSQIIYGASLGVVRSMDGGKTWRSLALPPPAAYLPRVAAFGGLVYAGAYDGGVYRSNNGGSTWKESNQGITNQRVHFLAAHASRPTTLFGSDGTSLFKSVNDGAKWTRVRSAVNVYSVDIEIHPQNANLIVAADATGIAGISTNGGATWVRRGGISDYSGQYVALDPQNQNNMFVASFQSGVARSTDRGSTWSLVNSGLSDLAITAIVSRDGQNLFVGTRSGKIFRTSNGGNSWENSSTGLGAGEINGIVIDRTNSNIVYLSTDYQGKGVYKSIDGGRTWTLKSKGFNGSTGIFSHPSKPGTLYGPTYAGVFVTSDGAETWSLLPSNGLGIVQGFSFLVNPAHENAFYLGTNRGVSVYSRTVAPGGPALDQTTPSFARAGATVTLTGAGFGPTQGGNRVTFGTLNAGTAKSWSDTKIIVNVPSGSIASYTSVIVGSKGSNPLDFVVPSNQGKVNPTNGGAGTRVTVTLTVRPTSGLMLVQFGSNLATEIQIITGTNIVTCVVPPGTGTVPVTAYAGPVRNSLGTYTYN